jgi:hypothetical protein
VLIKKKRGIFFSVRTNAVPLFVESCFWQFFFKSYFILVLLHWLLIGYSLYMIILRIIFKIKLFGLLVSFNRFSLSCKSFESLGASSGIGRELAKQLARLSPSTRLILSARREQELRILADELNLDFEHCLVLPLDLELQYDCFKSKFDLALERFDHIDILINNAGISQRSFIRDTVYNVDSRLMNINFLGTVTLSKTVLHVSREFLVMKIELKIFF